MKPVKNSVLAVLLLSLFAFKTFAGDIQTPGAAAPPPPPTNVMITCTDDGTQLSSDPNAVQSGETVVSSDLLFDAIAALLYIY